MSEVYPRKRRTNRLRQCASRRATTTPAPGATARAEPQIGGVRERSTKKTGDPEGESGSPFGLLVGAL